MEASLFAAMCIGGIVGFVACLGLLVVFAILDHYIEMWD